jgi:hypothetical protein
MAEGRGDGVRSGAEVQVAEEHGADDGDTDGAAEPLGDAESGADRACLLFRYPGEQARPGRSDRTRRPTKQIPL